MDNLHKQFDMMKKKNESLIYNVLPSHVVKDFIGVQRNDDVSKMALFAGLGSYHFLPGGRGVHLYVGGNQNFLG